MKTFRMIFRKGGTLCIDLAIEKSSEAHFTRCGLALRAIAGNRAEKRRSGKCSENVDWCGFRRASGSTKKEGKFSFKVSTAGNHRVGVASAGVGNPSLQCGLAAWWVIQPFGLSVFTSWVSRVLAHFCGSFIVSARSLGILGTTRETREVKTDNPKTRDPPKLDKSATTTNPYKVPHDAHLVDLGIPGLGPSNSRHRPGIFQKP